MASNTVIVIPVYKTQLTELEEASLINNVSKLRQYAISIICPISLEVSYVTKIGGKDIEVIRFEDHYFENLEGYNKLLRSSRFYQTFIKFEYLLIMQLDTFVFQTDLEQFCNKGYDYWGAPWIDYELVNYSFLRPVLPILHKSRYLRPLRNLFGKKYLVGNGGLSLRKVSTHLLVTQRFEKNIERFELDFDKWIKGGATSMMEDVFWTLYAPKFYPQYKIAPWEEAIKFSFEMNPREAYRLNNNELPFGCHAFAKVDPGFYKPFINNLN